MDELDRLLSDARAAVPEGLAGRLVAAARSQDAQRRVFWADVDRTARRALTFAAAAAVVTVALAVSTLMATPAPDNTQKSALVEFSVSVDQLMQETP